LICCLADFAIFPIMFTVVQFWENEAANDAFRQWVPITLQGGGLFHVSMCAVLGVSAYGRTQEKLAGQSAVPDAAGLPSPTLTPTGGSNGSIGGTGGFNTPAAPAGFGGASTAGFSAPASNSFSGGGFGSASTPAASGFGGGFGDATAVATTASGKKIVPDQPQPLL
jgi:hypothetical protein